MRDFRSDTRASFRNFDLLIALDRYEFFCAIDERQLLEGAWGARLVRG